MVYTVTRPCTLSLVKQWCSLVHRHPAGSHSQIICPVMVVILLGVDNSMSLVLQAIKKVVGSSPADIHGGWHALKEVGCEVMSKDLLDTILASSVFAKKSEYLNSSSLFFWLKRFDIMNTQKRICELFRFREDIRSRSLKIVVATSLTTTTSRTLFCKYLRENDQFR